jgi:RNA polymerase sigma factor (sigma-70 family)
MQQAAMPVTYAEAPEHEPNDRSGWTSCRRAATIPLVRDDRGTPGSERLEEESGRSRGSDAAGTPGPEVLSPVAKLAPAGRDDAIDDSTFDGLMAAHGDAVYSLCLRVLRDPVLAEDTQQHVFLQAHRDFAKFEGRAKRRTWLFSIAIHRCMDAIKAERRWERRILADEAAVLSFADPATRPDTQIAKQQQLAALERCMATLSSDARLVVLARFLLEMSYEQMAPALNTKADTLQTRVERALPVLKRCMERKGWASD